MLKQEIIELYGKQFRKSYSDADFYILQVETGIEYDEAIDILNAPYTYQETTHLIKEGDIDGNTI